MMEGARRSPGLTWEAGRATWVADRLATVWALCTMIRWSGVTVRVWRPPDGVWYVSWMAGVGMDG